MNGTDILQNPFVSGYGAAQGSGVGGAAAVALAVALTALAAAVTVLVVVWIARLLSGKRTPRGPASIAFLLDTRLARGDIGVDEYRRLRQELFGRPQPPAHP